MQHVSGVSQASHVDLQATSPLKRPDQLWQVTGDPVIRQCRHYCKDITTVYVWRHQTQRVRAECTALKWAELH